MKVTNKAWTYLLKRVVCTEGGCWEWTLAVDSDGYPYAAKYLSYLFKVQRVAHAVLIMTGRGRPKNLISLHSCDNRKCVNPLHLRWGTHKSNADDRKRRGRFTYTPVVFTDEVRQKIREAALRRWHG